MIFTVRSKEELRAAAKNIMLRRAKGEPVTLQECEDFIGEALNYLK
jgi:hypothetical protein